MRRFIGMVLIGALCSFAACSYATDFVIVNESDGPIVIRYEVKNYPGPFYPPVAPAVVPAFELSESGQQWNAVPFELDEASRTVSTYLLPGQALRIATMNNYSGHDYANDEYKYQIRRITLSGTRGEINLTDEQARTTFTKVTRTLYTLTYK